MTLINFPIFLFNLFMNLVNFIIDSANYIIHSIQFLIRFPISIMDIILNLDLPPFFIYGLITFVILSVIIITFKILSWFI